jgi:hypothetical protein
MAAPSSSPPGSNAFPFANSAPPNGAPATRDLTDLYAAERDIYAQLDAMERTIYAEETRYLDETAQSGAGNIVVGWEGAIEGKMATRRGMERVFSGSSATWEQQQRDAAGSNGGVSGLGLENLSL